MNLKRVSVIVGLLICLPQVSKAQKYLGSPQFYRDLGNLQMELQMLEQQKKLEQQKRLLEDTNRAIEQNTRQLEQLQRQNPLPIAPSGRDLDSAPAVSTSPYRGAGAQAPARYPGNLPAELLRK